MNEFPTPSNALRISRRRFFKTAFTLPVIGVVNVSCGKGNEDSNGGTLPGATETPTHPPQPDKTPTATSSPEVTAVSTPEPLVKSVESSNEYTAPSGRRVVLETGIGMNISRTTVNPGRGKEDMVVSPAVNELVINNAPELNGKALENLDEGNIDAFAVAYYRLVKGMSIKEVLGDWNSLMANYRADIVAGKDLSMTVSAYTDENNYQAATETTIDATYKIGQKMVPNAASGANIHSGVNGFYFGFLVDHEHKTFRFLEYDITSAGLQNTARLQYGFGSTLSAAWEVLGNKKAQENLIVNLEPDTLALRTKFQERSIPYKNGDNWIGVVIPQ